MSHVSRLTARVAGHGLRQQVVNLDHAEDLAGESESIIRRHWRAIVKRLATYDDPFGRFKPGEAAADITAILAAMDRELQDAFIRNLGWIAVQAHNQTADTLAAQLPLNSLKSQAIESVRRGVDLLCDMPDYRQIDDYDCGAACVHAVAEYFGIDAARTQADYCRELGTTKSGGTHPSAIVRWFRRNRLSVDAANGMTIEQLRMACEAGCPVICPIQRPEADPAQANANAAGHYVIVLSVEGGRVEYHDPLSGRRIISAERFDSRWHDIESDGDYSDHCGIVVGRGSYLAEDESGPGIVKLSLGNAAKLRVKNLANPLNNPDLSDTAKRDLMRELIFPPPEPRQVFGIVYAGDWRKRLAVNTKLAAPREVARVIQQGFVAGASQREIAKALLPVLDGVRISARRVAHNESMRVAHTMQAQAWSEVDDLITGYQIHAVDDGHNPTSRPEHRARHETVYYKKPRGSQKGLDQRPNPPYEADGSLAHFCRCWLTPVFGAAPPLPAERATSPLDPEVVSSWFDAAKPSQRKAAVGNARYAFVADMLDREPNWMDFIDAAGRLLSLDALRTLFQVG